MNTRFNGVSGVAGCRPRFIYRTAKIRLVGECVEQLIVKAKGHQSSLNNKTPMRGSKFVPTGTQKTHLAGRKLLLIVSFKLVNCKPFITQIFRKALRQLGSSFSPSFTEI